MCVRVELCIINAVYVFTFRSNEIKHLSLGVFVSVFRGVRRGGADACLRGTPAETNDTHACRCRQLCGTRVSARVGDPSSPKLSKLAQVDSPDSPQPLNGIYP